MNNNTKKYLIVFLNSSSESLLCNYSYNSFKSFFDLNNLNYEELRICSIEDFEKIKTFTFDKIFLLTYGSYGNDGTIQKFLEDNNYTFTYSDAITSKTCYDKKLTYNLLQSLNIKYPIQYNKDTYNVPCIVKKNNTGGSLAVYYIDNLQHLLDINVLTNTEYVCEEYIDGQEYTIFMVGELIGYPTKIIKKEGFINDKSKSKIIFDYTYYERNNIRNLMLPIISNIKSSLNLKTGSIDFIIKNNEVYIIDINSMPSILNESYNIVGMQNYTGFSYTDIINYFIEL